MLPSVEYEEFIVVTQYFYLGFYSGNDYICHNNNNNYILKFLWGEENELDIFSIVGFWGNRIKGNGYLPSLNFLRALKVKYYSG